MTKGLKSALKKYQKATGLKGTGLLDYRSLNALSGMTVGDLIGNRQ